MTRLAFIAISMALAACGGTDFTGFNEQGATGGNNAPDASGPVGSGGSSNGSGGSSSGAAGAVGSGGAAGTGTGGATGTGGTGGATGTGGRSGAGGTGGRPGTGGGAGTVVVVDAGSKDATPPIEAGSGGACKMDSDCRLSDTCCGCVALGPNDKAPVCNLQCIQSACSAQQIHGVRCSQGKCVPAPDCDSRNVTCRSLPEPCPPGQVPSVKGTCWGGCVVASSCRTVADCKACESDAYLCARQETLPGAVFRCIDAPASCGLNPGCECASSVACLPPYNTCNASMSGKQLNCSCPTC